MKFDIWLFLENPAERVDVCVLCLSCDVLIPRSEEPYHACVLVCYPESSTVKRHRPDLGCCPIDKINLYSWFCVLVTYMNFTFVLRRLCFSCVCMERPIVGFLLSSDNCVCMERPIVGFLLSSDSCVCMERPIVGFLFDLYNNGRNKIQNRVSYKQ